MNIEMRHLRYFIAVAEECHFGRAARRLAISQPPLSQQIMALEALLGARLLSRTNRSVQLTAAGEQFLLDARQIVQQTAQAAERAARLHQGLEGELRIGFTSSAPLIPAVSDALLRFRQRYPAVHISMREMNTRQQLTPLEEGHLDLSVMRNTPLPPSLDWQLLRREPLMALVHRDHPLADRGAISIRALANEPFIFFDPHVGTGLYSDILALLQRYAITPFVTQEVGEAMTILGLVATGLGVSLLPMAFRRAQLDNLVWLPLLESDARSEVWLVWAKGREPGAAFNTMRSLLLAGAPTE
ncbi:LysR family transcriptional regulator [Pantoea sp. 1.19]|uniref:LysR family transcriptional regulator n=1 Tax=Pantoea sp. 1.19 TaxID=1925589 RepID=UPI0009491343|nr:LysR family transcriptional regulator [Pantoea sp. 1.19]